MPRFDKSRLANLLEDFGIGSSARELREKYKLTDKSLFRYLLGARSQNLISDSSLSRIVADRTRYDFPRDPEGRLESVLSCMNGEVKQATLLVIGRDPATRSGIRRRLTELTAARLPGVSTFFDYCMQTLCPAGFVIHEVFGTEIPCNCFRISEAGEKYAQPIAAFSLRYAVENNISLGDLLGTASSAGDSRAPYNRTRIIELLAAGCQRIVELETDLGLGHTDITYHLKHLQARGLLRFQSLSPQPGLKIYRWVEGRRPEDARTVATRKRLSEQVARWLYVNQSGTYRQVAQELNYKHIQDVSKVLAGLARQGLATTEFPSISRSEVALGEKVGLLWNYARAVRSALSDRSELKTMSAMFDEFRGDRDLFRRYLEPAVELYSAVSPMMNARKWRERESELLSFIAAFQTEYHRGPRPSEMMERLGWNHGTLRIYINSLIRKRQLVRKREGTTVRYTLPT